MRGDAVSRTVTIVLLLMSIASWVVIVGKSTLLARAGSRVDRAVAAFWQCASFDDAQRRLDAVDRDRLVRPALTAVQQVLLSDAVQTLAGQGERSLRLTRALRGALHLTLRRLQSGQIVLATVGATAPFVGLLGTVWGIYRALAGIANAGGLTIDKVAGPVGQALIMTAAGLAVAIPAVLAYNVFGRVIGRVEAELEGFAHDLLAQFASVSPATTVQLPGAIGS